MLDPFTLYVLGAGAPENMHAKCFQTKEQKNKKKINSNFESL